jgi:hypothetical protein
MFGSNLLTRLLSSTPHFQAPDLVEVPSAWPVVEPSVPKAKRKKRVYGPRMLCGTNQAVLRALDAAHCYLFSDIMTLKAAAEAHDSSAAYVRAALDLSWPRWAESGPSTAMRRALLDAALAGHLPLLKAARTPVATNLAILTDND